MTVSKAIVRAAELLQLRQSSLARILGISPATASRLCAGTYVLNPARTKEWELALLLIRLFRSLDAVLGHGESARQWLAGENLGLNGRPADLIESAEGLVRVLHYLDAHRGRI
ncbi:antitoxin Xre/MbcA/ParS toxin-binding domain-containing protein [Noviherbaspirillum cavernae]|nr:antitoxin Xre/MbcA/ParS toxin-binding domain-containing protein [Noviherbaspirillum cavernae]